MGKGYGCARTDIAGPLATVASVKDKETAFRVGSPDDFLLASHHPLRGEISVLHVNPYFGTDKLPVLDEGAPFPSDDVTNVMALLASCPAHRETPLLPAPAIAKAAGVGEVWLKDETGRMGLGSFKALGAAYVIACDAARTDAADMSEALAGRTYITASAGNHGLSVAAGARIFGADAVIYLATTVPSAFAGRLRSMGATVCVEGADYEASMTAAQRAAEEKGYILLSDSSWPNYFERPHRLMEGYLASAHEAVSQIPKEPTHIFLQAGVGGLAGAMAAYFRKAWSSGPYVTVVEPEAAPALQASIGAGQSVFADGPVSNMGRLDCKEPSLIALKGLARDANFFLTISDDHAARVAGLLAQEGIRSTPSGVAGVAGLLAARQYPDSALDDRSSVLCIISEGDDT